MASFAANFSKIFNLQIYHAASYNLPPISSTFVQVRNYAARKGTRERRLKLLRAQKNKKQDEKKKEPYKKKVQILPTLNRSYEHKKVACSDDVVVHKYFRWKVYPFAEAIQCHRETHHPSMYNVPDALVQAHIELDMTGAKKNRFVDPFTRIIALPHIFKSGEERSVMALCNTNEIQQEAKEAGADLVGGSELVKQIEKGQVPVQNFDYVVAHPNIVPELLPIRNIIRKVYPSVRHGTLSPDVRNMVLRFRHGIKYTTQRDENEQDYGLIKAYFGKLDMEVAHLQENLQALLRDIYSVRPKRPGDFITRILLLSEPSREWLKLDISSLLPEQLQQSQIEEDSDEEDEEKRNSVKS